MTIEGRNSRSITLRNADSDVSRLEAEAQDASGKEAVGEHGCPDTADSAAPKDLLMKHIIMQTRSVPHNGGVGNASSPQAFRPGHRLDLWRDVG